MIMDTTESVNPVAHPDTSNNLAKAETSQDADTRSDRSSSVELKYQSSSAESIGRPDSDKEENKSQSTRSSSASRSRSNSKISLSRRERDRLEFRRDRPFANNFRRDRFDRFKFKKRNRVYRPVYIPKSPSPTSSRDERRRRSRSTRSSEKHSSRKVESSERKMESSKKSSSKSESKDKKLDRILKPSEIKNSAKQTNQTFLEMVQESKQKNQAFGSKPVIQLNETKTIPVKIHHFVNTFNSLANKNASQFNGKNMERSPNNKNKTKKTRTKKRRDSSSSYYSSDSSPERKRKKSDNLNSSREEGEIRSDSDEAATKPRKSKMKNSRNWKISDSDSSDKSKKAKKATKRKRNRSSSSDSSYSSSDSSSTSSSSSSSSASSSDSESSSSFSSSSFSSSSGNSSSSSDDQKKKVRRKQVKVKKAKRVSNKRKEKNQQVKKVKVKQEKIKNKKLIGDEPLKCESGVEGHLVNCPTEPTEMSCREPWPGEVVHHTNTKPSLQFAINRKYTSNITDLNPGIALPFDRFIYELESKYGESRRKDKSKKSKGFDDKSTKLPFIGKMKGFNKANKNKIRQLLSNSQPIKLDMSNDYNYYQQYYEANVFPYMETNDFKTTAQYIAYYQMFNSYDYNQQQLSEWASKQGFNLIETSKYDMTESSANTHFGTNEEEGKVDGRIEVITTNQVSSRISTEIIKCEHSHRIMNGNDESNSPPISPPPARPKMTFLEAVEQIKLPNGITLPPGTKQIIVHPYNRPIY